MIKNEPTDSYSQFMNLDGGPRILGNEIRQLYGPMFAASHTPYNESAEKLKNLFNIHSGGGERSLEYQIQTFKALCENAAFDSAAAPIGTPAPATALGSSIGVGPAPLMVAAGQPIVNINLHIHLPENKTRRDHEDIIRRYRPIYFRSRRERQT